MSYAFPTSWFLNVPRRRRPSPQLYLSQSSASSDMFSSVNGDAGAYVPIRSSDSPYTVPNVGGHRTAGHLQGSIGLQPGYTWVNCSPGEDNNLYLTVGGQHAVSPLVIGQPQDMPLPPSPVAPSPYTDTSDSSVPPRSPMDMGSPFSMNGPPAGQSVSPSSPFQTRHPSTLTRRPSYETLRSDGSGTRYRCRDCPYETQRKCDMRRHRDGFHSKKKHYCSFQNCNKSYTRKYKLEQHERKHLLHNN